MRRFALALLSSAVMIGAASAADLPVKARPYAAPAFSWTGIYVGGNVGYGWGSTHGTAANPLPGNFDIDGGLAGLQIGANYQMQNWVLGIEADYQWADIDGSNTVGAFADSAKVSRFGTVRGRLGYAWDRWMVYGTGGWAFNARTRYSFVTPAAATDAHNLSGWAAGAGLEYAFAPNWSAKVEYLHVDLDQRDYGGLGCLAGACRVGTDIDTVRLGVNYRFGGGMWR